MLFVFGKQLKGCMLPSKCSRVQQEWGKRRPSRTHRANFGASRNAERKHLHKVSQINQRIKPERQRPNDFSPLGVFPKHGQADFRCLPYHLALSLEQLRSPRNFRSSGVPTSGQHPDLTYLHFGCVKAFITFQPMIAG